MTQSSSRPLPGDESVAKRLERYIRVDHAGEYGAARIYAGQLAVLRNRETAAVIRHMQAQEEAHLETFSTLLAEQRVRPTALLPFWHIAGFALGAATAALGTAAAMACTVAVEDVIDSHYAAQATSLTESDGDLRATIERFRADEVAHRDIGLDHGAQNAPAYKVLRTAIQIGCRLAIRLSERI